MKPVKVKTVQVKAGQLKLASAGSAQPVTAITNAIPPARPEVPETSSAVVAKAETNKAETNRAETNRPEPISTARMEMPPQPQTMAPEMACSAFSASSVPSSPSPQAMAYADPAPRAQRRSFSKTAPSGPRPSHTGWIVQVGALESEGEARQRIEAARNQARGLLAKADPFTEPVVAKGDRKLFRARFAGLDREQAEAVCRTLKRSDISCIAVRN